MGMKNKGKWLTPLLVGEMAKILFLHDKSVATFLFWYEPLVVGYLIIANYLMIYS